MKSILLLITTGVSLWCAQQTITFAPLKDRHYGEAPFAVTATASSGLPVSFRIVSGPAVIKGDLVTLAGIGRVVIGASQAGDAQFAPAAEAQQAFAVVEHGLEPLCKGTPATASLTMMAAGGRATVEIRDLKPAWCVGTPVSGADWLTFTAARGRVEVRAAANTGKTARNALLFVGGQPVTVKQFAPSPRIPREALQALMEKALARSSIPGVVMGVATPEEDWTGAAGVADVDSRQPMDAAMQVRIASITKPFTAALILKLAEEKKLSLNERVDKWVPDLFLGGSPITIAMLLNHTSGIPDHEELPEFWTRLFAGPSADWTALDVIGLMRTAPRWSAPGTRFEYSNTGYYILGMIAEAASGSTVAEEVEKHFFKPLGMTRTSLERDGRLHEPYARQYTWDPYQRRLAEVAGWNFSWDWTAGSAVTTAGDMLKWGTGLFGGRVLSVESLRTMMTAVPPSELYGSGLILGQDGDSALVGHTGGNPGSVSLWHHLPDSGVTIFISGNRMDVDGEERSKQTLFLITMLEAIGMLHMP